MDAVLIAGPTASGKSAIAEGLAVRCAETGYSPVVINADASQVYADLRILSARPMPDEMADVPHHLFGTVDGAIAFSVANWATAVGGLLRESWAAKQLPILVGGTGLYFAALTDGLADIPQIPEAIRGEVRSLPVGQLATALAKEDPVMAARLKPIDRQRLARALEVVRATGRSLAHWQAETPPGILGNRLILTARLDPPRAKLYARCDARFDAMLDQGALDEVRLLSARGLDPDLPVMKALGVPQLSAVLANQMDISAAIEDAKRQTRRYAKRQTTWFSNRCADWPVLPWSGENIGKAADGLLQTIKEAE